MTWIVVACLPPLARTGQSETPGFWIVPLVMIGIVPLGRPAGLLPWSITLDRTLSLVMFAGAIVFSVGLFRHDPTWVRTGAICFALHGLGSMLSRSRRAVGL